MSVKEKQHQHLIFLDLQANIHKKRVLDFEQGGDSVMKYQCRLCIPKVDGLQQRIMEKTHSSRYSIYIDSQRCTAI